ncbi:ATP-binding protein [Eubacterium sp.]|uniref:ATP-binding protein n=1 Tax=Eubacterium sp. TaxID=142586 RepID=UPI002FCB94C4
MEKDKRITIITGHYGSGKTEFALNYALARHEQGESVILADMDIVNTYFRSRERSMQLEKLGISVLSSSIIQDNVDLPAVSAAIDGVLRGGMQSCVIDLGGNDVGTRPLGRLHPIIDQEELDVYIVVNTNRPDTATASGICRQIEALERASGYRITGLVNNTNLIWESTADNLKASDSILRCVAERTGIPVRYTAYVPSIIGQAPSGLSGVVIPMSLFMRKDWM